MRALLAFALLVVIAAGLAAPASAQYWQLAEMQPNIPNGGRANGIAVNPSNPNVMLVASESGGLFRSVNGGGNWLHVDSLPEYRTNAVMFLPANPLTAIATVDPAFRAANGGGIWRSTDSGISWTQVYSPASPPGSSDRFAGREISIASDTGTVYVATSFGVAISNDQGLSWRLSEPFGLSQREVVSVLAQRGNLVIAGGPAGLRRSLDGGSSWTVPSTPIAAGIFDLHALAGSPLTAAQVFVVDGDTALFASEDAGDHWTRIVGAPGGGGACGGIAFIKATAPSSGFGRIGLTLYFGNRCGVYRLTPPHLPDPRRFDLSGAWSPLTVDHGDPRDMGFSAVGRPLLLGTDGGLHKTSDRGASWTFAGGGSAGYNALQITEIASQRITAGNDLDLYFGTQDNNVWASSDFGASWTAALCCEGFFFELEHQISRASDAQVTFVLCGPCSNELSGRLFANVAQWPEPPNSVGNPKILGNSFQVEAVDNSPGLRKGLASSFDAGSSWHQYAVFPESPRALPKFSSRFVRPLAWTVLYQPINVGFDPVRRLEINHFVRTREILGLGARVTYPRMNNFGGLGITPTMFAWYQVFAVDPQDPNHLIAPDVIGEQMKESRDGGDNWADRSDLKALFTANGAFRFKDGMFSQVTALSFSPDDPNFVAAGTAQAGLFISTDRGATWTSVAGSERVTYVTSLEWVRPYHLLVASYGRGLWSVTRMFRFPHVPQYCEPCRLIRGFVDPLWDPAPERLSRAVVVLDGQVLGVRLAGRRLSKLYVSPGSRVAWSGNGPPPVVAVRTASRWMRLVGWHRLGTSLRRTEVIVGVAMNAESRVIGLVASPRPLDSSRALFASQPAPAALNRSAAPDREVGLAQSPTAGRPYVEISGLGAANRVKAGAAIEIEARDLPSGAAVTISIDERVWQQSRVAADGSLAARAIAPGRTGLHTLTVEHAQGRILTGLMFLVVAADEDEGREPHERRRRHSERN
jgi:photosystem II stability/assembly factor-like uncharacterized protein